jgi:hypothetical protein
MCGGRNFIVGAAGRVYAVGQQTAARMHQESRDEIFLGT